MGGQRVATLVLIVIATAAVCTAGWLWSVASTSAVSTRIPRIFTGNLFALVNQAAVREERAEIAGAIRSLVRTRGIRQERRGCEVGAIPVSWRQEPAPHGNLSHLSRRNFIFVIVEERESLPGTAKPTGTLLPVIGVE